jgi:hypothetical protein
MNIRRRIKILSSELFTDQPMYHGTRSVEFIIKPQPLFLSPSPEVAKQYAQGQVLMKPRQGKFIGVVHPVQVKLTQAQVFNPANTAAMTALTALVRQYNTELKTAPDYDPDDYINPHGLVQRGADRLGLSFGYISQLIPLLQQLKYKAAIVNEGSQGWSLVVFNPIHDVVAIK